MGEAPAAGRLCPNRSSIDLPQLEGRPQPQQRHSQSAADGCSGGGGGLLPWDRFGSWMHAVCVVTFDLELGQAMEVVYPRHAEFTEVEKSNICYLAFPDSNSGCMGDTSYYVRMRRFTSRPLRPPHALYNQRCAHTLKIDSNHYYGYVYFRQVKDKNLPRGYFQKSVVIVSLLPLVALFTHVVETIAPHFFDTGEPALEAACHDMDQWPPPDPQHKQPAKSSTSATLHLPLMGTVIQCRLPARDACGSYGGADGIASLMANSPRRVNAASVILPSVHELPMFEYVAPLVHHLQLLWELVLLNEPLAVMAPSPKVSSGVVHALVSLIWPLRCAADYRPFFTIHDSEFKEYTANGRGRAPNVLLGVTNPFFSKTLKNWSHIVRLAEPGTSAQSSPMCGKRTQKTADIKTLDNKAGLYTHYKPYLSKDKAFVKRVMQGMEAQRPEAAQTALVRRHFLELTHSFMIPLERYLASLMPLRRCLSPLRGPPAIRHFDTCEMVASLDGQGPDLTTGVRGDWAGLYRRFARTANFAAWQARRRRDMQHTLAVAHADVVLAADWRALDLPHLSEAHTVDLVFMLKEKLDYMECHAESAPPQFRHRMIGQIEAVLGLVSDDLRLVLLSNRQLALRRICSIEYMKSLVE